ncbi:DUF2971 domain-containing protein [Variovorax sp. J22P240]|uniref:DUF2971 domain-containing protein n=1 Tax=Variovorax sp. J22P240 TaxID=3053514 RepID=UPI0033654607
MWAHYADNHRGCVLGFRHIHERDTPFAVAHRIRYSDRPPIGGSGLDFVLYGPTRRLSDRLVRAICFTRELSWSYEREWRSLTYQAEPTGTLFDDLDFFAEELESVTLGPRTTLSSKKAIAAICRFRYPSCAMFKIESKKGEYVRRPI